MADEPLTQLYAGATWPNGYSVSNLMLLLDVTDLAMGPTGTDKGVTVSDWLTQYIHAGSNITLTPGSTGVTISSAGGSGGAVSSVFTRTGSVVAASGDYSVGQVTGAAPAASPVFTGTVKLPVGLTGVLKAASGVVSTASAGTDYLAPNGSGAALTGITESQVSGLVSDLSAKAPLASPTFTGSVTLPAGTVTLAEQANLAASSLMGNPTGSPAAPSAITLGTNMSFSGTTLVSSNPGGTVTSVSWTGDGTIFTASADTPVTSSGTLAPASLISQVKNTFLGGPATGSNAAPTFRVLGTSDIPDNAVTYAKMQATGAGSVLLGNPTGTLRFLRRSL